MENKMEKYVVKRDGQRNLSFTGSLLSEASSWMPYGENENRWEELALYKTKGGKYVLSYEYNTAFEGENEEHKAFVADNIENIVKKYQAMSEYGIIPDVLKHLLEKAGFDFTEEIE